MRKCASSNEVAFNLIPADTPNVNTCRNGYILVFKENGEGTLQTKGGSLLVFSHIKHDVHALTPGSLHHQ